jgi:hypothetical protein
MRRSRVPNGVLDTPSVKIPRFGTGAAAGILGIPIWRLQKFVDVKSYQLTPAGIIGAGAGSRRLFSTEDLYRLQVAVRMLADGFRPNVVSKVLNSIEDDDFYARDDQGEELPFAIGLFRGEDEPVVRHLRRGDARAQQEQKTPFYELQLDPLIALVQRSIRSFLAENSAASSGGGSTKTTIRGM